MFVRFSEVSTLRYNDLLILAKKLNTDLAKFEDYEPIKSRKKAELVSNLIIILKTLDDHIYQNLVEIYGEIKNPVFNDFRDQNLTLSSFIEKLSLNPDDLGISFNLNDIGSQYNLAKKYNLPYSMALITGYLAIHHVRKEAQALYESRINQSKSKELEGRSYDSVSTEATPIHKNINKNKTQDLKVSVHSPNLQSSFQQIGYTDQNGFSVLGDEAARVLTALYTIRKDSLYSSLRPPQNLIDSGVYYYPCRLEIEPEYTQVELDGKIIKRPVYIPHTTTRVVSNKVVSQGFNSKTRTLSLQALFFSAPIKSSNGKIVGYSEPEIQLDRVKSIQWGTITRIETKKGQNKKTSTYKKDKVKSKISWGTKFVGVNWDHTLTHGITVSLPNDPGNTSSKRYRMVLEPSGNISLYNKNNTLFGLIGKYSVEYSQTHNSFDLKGSWVGVPAHWIQSLDKNISRLIYSNSRIQEKLKSEMVVTHNHVKFAKQVRSRLTPRQYKRLNQNARKVAFHWLDNPEKKSLLPIDVMQACLLLRDKQIILTKQDGELVKDEIKMNRNTYQLNAVIISWYQRDILGKSIVNEGFVNLENPDTFIKPI
jgi:hypothetical protein